MFNNYVLCKSSFLFLLPIKFYFYKKENKTIENTLAILLTINFLLSFIFWYNPIYKSKIHKIDAIFAKISLVSFTIYILFVKNNKIYSKLLGLLLLNNAIKFYVKGTKYLSIEWCSPLHIYNHFLFHIFISMCCFFAFLE